MKQDTHLQTKRKTDLSLVIDGCVISLTSSQKETDEPLKIVREILLSAYQIKKSRLQAAQGFFDVSTRK